MKIHDNLKMELSLRRNKKFNGQQEKDVKVINFFLYLLSAHVEGIFYLLDVLSIFDIMYYLGRADGNLKVLWFCQVLLHLLWLNHSSLFLLLLSICKGVVLTKQLGEGLIEVSAMPMVYLYCHAYFGERTFLYH